MIKVIKNKGKIVKAYKLGSDSRILDKLIEEDKLKELPDGVYEVMSREAVKGGKTGEIVSKGDYVKLDSEGWPYPNDAAYFKANHKHISGCTYEQMPKPLYAWTADQPMCPEVRFLIAKKGLVLNLDDHAHYFNAELWGTMLSAAKDSVLIFYAIDRDENGAVTDADFNFVVKEEFDKTYSVLTEGWPVSAGSK